MPSRVAIDDPDGPSSQKPPPETAAATGGAAEDDAPAARYTSDDDDDADVLDPEHAAFAALVRSIVALCLQKNTTGRDDVEQMVRKYRGRYPQLSVRHIVEGIDEKLGRSKEGEGSDELQVVKRALHLFYTENEKAPPSQKVAVTAGTLQARAILARDVVVQQRRQNGGDGGVLENFTPTVEWVRGAADEYGWTLSDGEGAAKMGTEEDAGQKGVDDSRASEGTASSDGDNDHLQSIKRALHLFYTENETSPPEKRVEITLTALEARAILAKELVLERHRREGTVDEAALRTLEHTPITQTWLRETATEYGWTLSDSDAARKEQERAATLQRHANRLCTVDGCTRYRISDGVCRDHGGKRTRYRKPCTVEGCPSVGYARLGGVCQRHFALGHGDQEGKGKATPRTRRKCEFNGCDGYPEAKGPGERWLCRHHGGPKRKRRKRPPCTVEGCSNVSQIGGVCRSHGARQWTKTCKVEGCEAKVSTMYRLGFCYRHLPDDQKERCTAEGCTFLARKNGVCRTHGAELPLCTVEGCEKVRTSKSFCYRHSGKKYVARPCSVAGCTNQSQRRGLCVRHGGRKRCSTTGCEKQVVRGGLCISCGKYGPHGKKKRKHSEVSKEVAQLLHEAGVEQSAEESEKGAKANDAQEKGGEPTKGASAQGVAQTSTPQTTMFPNLSIEQRSEMATRFQQLMGPNQMPFPVPMMVPYQPFWYTGPPPPFGNALAAQAMWAQHSNPSNLLWQKSNQFSKGNEGAESSANNPGNAAPAANHATDGRKQSPAPAHDETASKIDAFLRLRRCNP